MIAFPSGHSWPSIHWWLTLNASEQGAWASGIGAFFSTFAAVGIAIGGVLFTRRREKMRRHYNARMLAIEITQTFIELRGQINIARATFLNSSYYLSNDGAKAFSERIYLHAADSLPNSHALNELPYSVAYAIADCRMQARGYNLNVKELPALDSPEYTSLEVNGPWRFDNMLDEAQRELARAAKELQQYVPYLSQIAWLERGDRSLIYERDKDLAPANLNP